MLNQRRPNLNHTSNNSSSSTNLLGHKRKPSVQTKRRNLAIFIMLVISIITFFAGLWMIFTTSNKSHSINKRYLPNNKHNPSHKKALRGTQYELNPHEFNEAEAASNANHLIIVAGHSVTISSPSINLYMKDTACDEDEVYWGKLENFYLSESAWFLLPYQHGQGLPHAILSHIRAGISVARSDPHSLLVFSGGETRASTGPVTEAASYFRVSESLNLWNEESSSSIGNVLGGDNNVRARTITEEFATDSFENFMFSICRFYEITGRYPDKITIVSFSFKESRFRTTHAKALSWPQDKLDFLGVDPPTSSGFDFESASKGEAENAAKPFLSDPYGCHSTVLQQKRKDRNPFKRTPPYKVSCPDMSKLLEYCGPSLFSGALPWNS